MKATTTFPPTLTGESVRQRFNPASIVLVGATDKSSWSRAFYANLVQSGFAGAVHLVNPRGGIVHDQQSYRSVADLPEPADLAIVMVPTGAVLDVMGEIADAGIRSAVVLTAGFGEVGEEGARLEEQLRALARERGITVLGPNGNGFVNVAAGITPYGLPLSDQIPQGSIGIVLQSGALASSVLRQARVRNAGLSLLVAMGNESMLSMTDVIDYLVDDEDTKVVLLFVESIRDPERFREVARRALAAGKPIVALKVGRSEGSAQVAKAHTGSLVGDDGVIDAVFRQSAVIRVDSLEDLIVTGELLARTGPLRGRRFAFVTPSGGACEVIADRAEDEGIDIPAFAPETEARLRAVMPDFASVHNPLDVTGYILVDGQLLMNALVAVEDDPSIDQIVVMTEPPAEPNGVDRSIHLERFRTQAELFARISKPVIPLATAMTDITDYSRGIMEDTGFPGSIGGIHHGLTALGRAADWSEAYWAAQDEQVFDEPQTLEPIELAVAPGEVFGERRSAALLAEHGIPVVPSVETTTADEAAAAADRVGYPVVVKLASDAIEHKSDIGGVRLGLQDADAVRDAFEAVVAAGRAAGATDVTALVQPMRPPGTELIVGVVRDPQWGPVLAVGLGGIWVEVLKDSTLHVLPVSHDRIKQGLLSLRAAKIFAGARGTEPADLDAVADVVTRIAQLAERLGDRLESLEVNPLSVRGSHVEALDALITWT